MNQPNPSVTMLDISNVTIIATRLTDDQKQCILDLSEEWKKDGYNRIAADLIYSTDSKFFPCRFGPLVDCHWPDPAKNFADYQHKLLPLGLEVQRYLHDTS